MNLPACPEVLASPTWQDQCGIQKLVQTDQYGCGVACLAMVAGISYAAAREHFNQLGLGRRRGCKAAYSTSTGEMRMAIATAGLLTETRWWKGWGHMNGLGILKVRDDWNGRSGQWHWVIAFRHPEFEIALFDPHFDQPAFLKLPQDTLCAALESYEPKGQWLQVEQRVPLVRNSPPGSHTPR